MADDIDIEEHDVLDNPHLRNIFPDISRIKEEVIQLDEDDDQRETYESYQSDDINISDHPIQISEPYHDPSTYVENTQEYPRHQNKIILGSKPSGESINIKVEPEESKGISPDSAECPVLRNLLILGSKCAANTTDQTSDTDEDSSDTLQDPIDEDEINPSTVSLEDWGPRLQASKCFCKECQILFPTRNVLDAHKMAVHSFLVALNTNKAVKSTAKHFRCGVASETQPASCASEVQVPGTSKFCNHCNKTFDNDTALITHLYQTLTFGKNNSKKMPAKVDPNVQELAVKVLGNPETNNLFLRCNICGVYFKSQLSYEKHMFRGHGLKSPSLKRVPYNGRCWFCQTSLVFTRETYNKHILRVHPKYFYNKKFSKPHQSAFRPAFDNSDVEKDSKSDPQASSAVKYQCRQCHEIFPDYTVARNHRKRKHPELKNVFILNKVYTKKNVPSYTIKKAKPVSKPQQTEFPMPIKMLFKCDKCDTHFINFMSGFQHTKQCQGTEGEWVCTRCRRAFMLSDKYVHQKQHSFSYTKFIVHKCNENMYHRVMYCCPKCKLCFHVKEFDVHYKNGCQNSTSVDCFLCNISVDSSCVKIHNDFHTKFDFGFGNLILVQLHAPGVLSLKRKLDESKEEVAAKKAKINDKITLYYCSHCKCSMLSKRHFTFHSQRQCIEPPVKKHICKICGIMVSSKRHAEFHDKNKNFKISNFRFVNLQTQKVMNPPIPDYPTCDNCGVRVIQSSALESHECDANYKTCWYCKKKFTDLAYYLHVRLHVKKQAKTEALGRYSKELAPNVSTSTVSPSMVSNQLPELLKKYEMLTKTWNIVYLCRTCDIIHDSYDSAVEHCQNHFNKMESYDVTIQNCDTCNLKLDSKCFEKHRSLHAQNKDIGKESFHILHYTYEDLLSPKWLDIFQSLPEEQSQHILNQSIYKNNRNFKLTVINNGAPEHTLYLCGKCDVYSTTFDLVRHVDCSRDQRTYRCRLCNMVFIAHSVRDAHEAEHKTTDNFRIVLFNSPEDVDFNKALTGDNNQNIAQVPKESIVHYYRCTKCKCCMKRRENMKMHSCHVNLASRKSCGRCGLMFWQAAVSQHMQLHKTNPYCTREHILLTDFTPNSLKTSNSNSDNKTAKIFKCSCGLHFISSKTIEKHLSICGTGCDIAKENCSKCNLLFDTHELFNHLCKHHSSDKYIKFDVEVYPNTKVARKDPENSSRMYRTEVTSKDRAKVQLYKCKKCGICYLSVNSLRYHYNYNKHQIKNSNKCQLCGLRFSPVTLKKHMELHHMKYKYKLSDFRVTVVDYKFGEKGTLQVSNKYYQDIFKATEGKEKAMAYTMSKKFLATLNLKFYSKKIYKCNNCSLHFISSQSLYSHKHNDGGKYCNSKSPGVSCNICGFTFSIYTLPRHKYIHHDKMKLQNLTVISDPPIKDQIVEAKVTKSLNVVSYDNTLYQCVICKINFLNIYSIRAHFMKQDHNLTKLKCNFCGYLFTKQARMKHIHVHHQKMQLKRNNFKIIVKNYNHGLIKTVDQTTKADGQYTVQTDEHVNVIDEQDTSEVVENEVQESLLSRRELATLDLKKYSSRVYKCGLCVAHFLRPRSLLTHYALNKHKAMSLICNECGLTFMEKTLRIHKYVQHNKMKLKKHDIEIIRIGKKAIVLGSQLYDETIYTCVICDLSFCNIGSADLHLQKVNGAHNNIGSKCDVCGLFFGSKALIIHKINHHKRMALKLEDFNIQIVGTKIKDKIIEYNSLNTDSFDETIPDDFRDSSQKISLNSEHEFSPYISGNNKLYKCTICSVHFFTESGIESHYQRFRGKNHEVVAINCSECNFAFSEKGLPRHQFEHHKGGRNFEDKDFLIIPFSEYNNNYIGNNYLYRCSICKAHFTRESSLENHWNSQSHSMRKLKCEICGLKFLNVGYYKHVSYFHRDTQLRREDIKVCENIDGKLVLIDIDDDNDDVEDGQVMERCIKEERKTEIDTKWKSILDLNNYDNTIYKCEKCPLHFITLISAKKHSTCRKDLTNTVGTCFICGLIFGPQTLPKHIYIHHEFHQLKREDFRIIQRPAPSSVVQLTSYFEPKSRQVDKQYENKSESPSQQYLENDDRYGNTLYRCDKCDLHFLTLGALRKHIHYNVFKSKCSECGLQFTNRSIVKHKLVHHETLKLKLKDFRLFNDTDEIIDTASVDTDITRDTDLESIESRLDIDGNNTLNATDPLAETSSVSTNTSEDGVRLRPRSNLSVSNISTTETDDTYSETIYRCEKCNTCFMDNKKHVLHFKNCTGKMIKLNCDICNLSFSIKYIGKHKVVHHERLKLSRDDFKIIALGDDSNIGVNDRSSQEDVQFSDPSTLDKSLYNNELYKCSICNIHFIGNNDFQRHMKSKDHEISRYHCTFCSLPFSLKALPIHIFIHHEEMNLNTEHFFIITDKDDLNEDQNCQTNDMASTSDVRVNDSRNQNTNGISVKSSQVSKETDIKSKDNTKNSIVESSSDLDSSAETLEPQEIEHKGQGEVSTYKSCIKLYKCSDCNVYFMTQPTCYKHMLKHKPLDNIEYIECKICGFQFRILSLHKHIKRHHNKEFKLENVLVEEYRPNENGPPTLDIYFAKDKLQSKLVSTTSESKCTVTSTQINDDSAKGVCVKSSIKPCTVTNEGIERENMERGNENTSAGTKNDTAETNLSIKQDQDNLTPVNTAPENVSLENNSTEQSDTIINNDIEPEDINTGNAIAEIEQKNTNNDEIEVNENIELEKKSIEIENLICSETDVNKITVNTNIEEKNYKIEPNGSMDMHNPHSNEDVIYIIEDNDDELENIKSINQAAPDIQHNEAALETGNGNDEAIKNDTEDVEIIMDNNLNVDNTEPDIDYRQKGDLTCDGNDLLTERIHIIDISDDETQIDVDNSEIGKDNRVASEEKAEDIVVIE